MKKFLYFLVSLLFIFVLGCNNDNQSKINTAKNVKPGTAVTNLQKVNDCNVPALQKALIQKYPTLVTSENKLDLSPIYRTNKFFGVHTDPNFLKLMRCSSFQELRSMQVIMDNGSIVKGAFYLDQQKAWDRKIRVSWKRSKAINQKIAKQILQCAKKHWTMNSLAATAQSASEEVYGKLPSSAYYSKYIDGDILMALLIHELIPTDYWDTERPEILRVLLEMGFQPNVQPAVYDGAASFGVGQMTFGTYNDTRHFGMDLGITIPEYSECLTVENQFKSVALHQHYNLWVIYKRLLNHPKLKEFWLKADDKERKNFLVTLLGTAHSLPLAAHRASIYLLKDIKTVQSLQECREAFLSYVKYNYPIAYRHGYRSGDVLMAFYAMTNPKVIMPKSPEADFNLLQQLAKNYPGSDADSPRVVVVPTVKHKVKPLSQQPRLVSKTQTKKQHPVVASKPQHKAIQIVTLPSVKKAPIRMILMHSKDGIPYYTYTVPDWKGVARIAEALCENPKTCMEQVKKFMDVKRLSPGHELHVPLALLKEDLRKGDIVKVAKANVTKQNESLAILYSGKGVTTLAELPGKMVRLPAKVL